MRAVFDIETDGLLDEVSLIHCLSYRDYDTRIRYTIHGREAIRAFIETPNITLIGHKIITYDMPVLHKLLPNLNFTGTLIDTLGISWYMFPQQKVHGLEWWGDFFGIQKPVIDDWENLTQAEYDHRCEVDVDINTRLFDFFIEKLLRIYDTIEEIDRLFAYLAFKLDCAREQEEIRWKLDVPKCNNYLAELTAEEEIKTSALREAMPLEVKYRTAKYPAKPYKKDGTLSAGGENWHSLLRERGLPETYQDPLKVEVTRIAGNPNSFTQIKAWLYSIGWVPQTIKYKPVKDENGNTIGQREIPQITKDDDSGNICDSIPLLYEREPALQNLESLSMIRHRMGILKGFLENKSNDDYLKAEINGFTNTMRFKHKIIVNLPKITRPYGMHARGSLTCPEGYILCGSDMASLEDTTKQHYMYYFDPEYVKEMRTPGFDPHIDISLLANLITEGDSDFFKRISKEQKDLGDDFIYAEGEKDRLKAIKKVRQDKGKKVNFAAVYGAGPPKIALSSGMPLEEAKKLHVTYWQRNKAVKKVAKAAKVITVDGQMWLHNPVSGFWYTLRFDKDRFSTLNQSTGVYCFDLQVRQVRAKGIKICGQFHDEIAFPLLPSQKEEVEAKLNQSIIEVNQMVNLNVPLGISIDYGTHYSDIH